ncbi:MAG: CvpA family protein, partial [Acidimicrobiales bacterium]
MDALDIIIIVVLVAAAIHGLRLGAAVQVLSFVGALVGVVGGMALALAVTPHLRGEFTRTFVAMLLLLVPAALVFALGRQVGAKAWRRMRAMRHHKL